MNKIIQASKHFKNYLLLLLLSISSNAHANENSEIDFPPEPNFFFGVANAPVQVEDQLDDNWLKFAKAGNISAFSNHENPEKKLEFWTKPEIEINLAKELGVSVFRLGIDWSRLMSFDKNLKKQQINLDVLAHYLDILKMIKSKKMKVMLTLFHHSEPSWTLENGSWSNKKMVDQFVDFAEKILPTLLPQVDYLITFNEAQLYVAQTSIIPLWPSYKTKNNPLGLIDLPFKKGVFTRSLRNISTAHHRVYELAKKIMPEVMIGIAHNVADYEGVNPIGKMMAASSWKKLNFELMDLISDELNFIGLNYYGVEKLRNTSLIFDQNVEYSDSGRGISPAGLYKLVHRFQNRYGYLKIPYIITENGIADEFDKVRPLYLIEHLKVISVLMKEGIPFLGYIHWTLTDNFEWKDGYCPKFGLVSVNRHTMERVKHDSFNLYQEIIATRKISIQRQNEAWSLDQSLKDQQRPSCRDLNCESSLGEYRWETFKGIDWRFQDLKVPLLDTP